MNNGKAIPAYRVAYIKNKSSGDSETPKDIDSSAKVYHLEDYITVKHLELMNIIIIVA